MVPIISITRFVYKWNLSLTLECKISKIYLLIPLFLQVLHDFFYLPITTSQKESEIHPH